MESAPVEYFKKILKTLNAHISYLLIEKEERKLSKLKKKYPFSEY